MAGGVGLGEVDYGKVYVGRFINEGRVQVVI
jgi:hypothetical protein